jgi:hypothetical protein
MIPTHAAPIAVDRKPVDELSHPSLSDQADLRARPKIVLLPAPF